MKQQINSVNVILNCPKVKFRAVNKNGISFGYAKKPVAITDPFHPCFGMWFCDVGVVSDTCLLANEHGNHGDWLKSLVAVNLECAA